MRFGGLEVTKRVKQSRFEHPHRARANKRQNMRGCCCWPRAVLIESSIASRIELNNFVHVQVLVSRCPTKQERPFELLKAYHSNKRAFNFSLLPFLQFSAKAFLLRPLLIDSFLFFSSNFLLLLPTLISTRCECAALCFTRNCIRQATVARSWLPIYSHNRALSPCFHLTIYFVWFHELELLLWLRDG